MSPKRVLTRLALPLLAGILVQGCPPATVIVTDEHGASKQVTVAVAAEMALAEAKRAAEAGQKKEAAQKYTDFLKRYPDADQLDEALFALGNLSFEAGRYEKAAGYFSKLIADYPTSKHYVRSAVQLGMALMKAGRAQEARPTLQSVFDRLDRHKQAEVAGMLAESYSSARAPLEALSWFCELYRLTEVQGAKEAIRERVRSLIDHSLNFSQVREAREILAQKEIKGFPADLLQFKLAKIFYHILDFQRAKEALETFVADYPGSAQAKEAGRLLKQIIDRKRVNPDTIGVLLPLSGEYREYGKRALQGIQLGAGIFDQTKKGAAGGPTLIIRDTAGDPDKAVEQLEDLVFNEHVVGVIGPMVAKEAYAAAVKAEELEVPIVSLSIRKEITKVGKYVFRNFLTLQAQSKALVSYAMEKLHAKRFAILYPNDWYGVEFANSFWDEIDRHQGEVRAAERYEPDEKNFATPIKKMVGRFYLQARWEFTRERAKIRSKIKSHLGRKRAMEKLLKSLRPVVDFDVLFVPDYVDKVVMIAPALAFEDVILHTDSHWHLERLKKSLGRDKLDMIYLLGGNGWDNPKVVEWAERYVQGAIFCDGFFLESNRPTTRLFVGKFKANFDRDPSMVEAQAYDTAMIFKTIFSHQHPQDRTRFLRLLSQVKNFDGATGTISFDNDGEAQKNLFLLTIEKDTIKEIDTGPATDEGKS